MIKELVEMNYAYVAWQIAQKKFGQTTCTMELKLFSEVQRNGPCNGVRTNSFLQFAIK